MKNIILNGVEYPSFFVTQEMILISTARAVYIVSTSIPNADPSPSNDYFIWVDEWLKEFKVIVR